MIKVITTERIPIKLWLDDIEEGALKQAENMANLPFTFKHIALMSDAHLGYGVPIGGVMATVDVIVVNAVGVDIGCGVVALKTNLTNVHERNLKAILEKVRAAIPVGFNHHKQDQDKKWMPSLEELQKTHLHWVPHSTQETVVEREWQRARKQVGTLGGGNHFIEIQKGNDGHVWIMIHSGSRNLGKQIADHYNKLAVELNSRWFSSVSQAVQLAFLPLGTMEAALYQAEMQYCVEFAFKNRELMLERVCEAFSDVLPSFAPEGEMINIAHNYAALENHFGRNVMVHRKGATRARLGELGVIPGSQGTKSYIVRGLGNKESFESCSHGAGRKMGRKAAQQKLDLKQQQQLLDSKGIIHSIRTKKDLDEAPGAYKNIREVIQNQSDLVEVVTKLSPLAVIKG